MPEYTAFAPKRPEERFHTPERRLKIPRRRDEKNLIFTKI
jgi:hypothetical protein